MDWRKITINALTGLAVAIVSGILVWALTKEPKYREGVFYEIENAGSFGSGEDKLSFYKISVKNNGEQKSRNLFFRLIPRNLSAIRQSEIKRSLSEPKISNKRSGTNGLNFNINELLPSEFINVYVVLSGAEKEPSIIIKTENSIVRRIENDDGEPSYSRYKLFIMLFFFGLSPLAMRFVLKTAYARGNFRFASKSKNNAGFLLFHSGLILLAEEILEAALKDGNSSPYELANLAAVKTFLGKEDESRRLIDAANYWSTRKDEIGIVKFNLFIISAYHSNYDQSLVYLNGSIDKHNEIKQYVVASSILRSIFDKNDDFKKRVNLILEFDQKNKQNNTSEMG